MLARRLRGPLTAALIALASVALLAVPAAAQDGAARELAERYAPVVVVRDQDAPCDTDGEPYRPVPVETVLDAQGVLLRDGTGAVVKEAPGMADIAGRGPETSLDFNGNPRRPGCTFEQDFDRLGAGRPDVAYAHVATDPAAPGRLALQYWFFWYFDDYVNTHEGDWEFVQLVWDAPTAEEALRTAPVEAGYSQHSGGERADWDGGRLERRGDHPVVYAAAGSHANFYTADLFLGRNADEGFGCDDARPPGTALQTQARLLPSGEVDPQGPDAWLLFQGRWGEFQKPPYDAPPGPRTKEVWSEPIAWQESLRDGSVAVPSGTTLGPTATGAFCAVVERRREDLHGDHVAPCAGADRRGPGDDGDGGGAQHRLGAPRAAPAAAHAGGRADAGRGPRRVSRATTCAAAHRAAVPARGGPGGRPPAGGAGADAPGRSHRGGGAQQPGVDRAGALRRRGGPRPGGDRRGGRRGPRDGRGRARRGA